MLFRSDCDTDTGTNTHTDCDAKTNSENYGYAKTNRKTNVTKRSLRRSFLLYVQVKKGIRGTSHRNLIGEMFSRIPY